MQRLLFGSMLSLTSSPQKSLQNKRVLSIDLAAIVAGSGIRGQFEEKFKALIKDIEDEVRLDLDSTLCSAPYAVCLTLPVGKERDLLHRRAPYVPVGIYSSHQRQLTRLPQTCSSTSARPKAASTPAR